MKYLALALIILATPAAAFGSHHGAHANAQGQWMPDVHPLQAPEIDPGFGFSAVLLLVGALAVIRGRKS